jgi:hypothetical protein
MDALKSIHDPEVRHTFYAGLGEWTGVSALLCRLLLPGVHRAQAVYVPSSSSFLL